MTRWVSTELKLNWQLFFPMFWKNSHTADRAKCQREHLIRELTFPAASSLEGAVDRQETQQREKTPHLCARISPHRLLTPSPGVCHNTPPSIGWPRVPRFVPTTNLVPPLPPAPRPQTPSVTGFLCAWDPLLWNPNSSSPCWARYTEEILLSVKLKPAFKKDKHTDHLLLKTSYLN